MRLAYPDRKLAPSSNDRQHTCRICGDAGFKKRYVAREMVHGTREPFDYLLCGNCETLYLADPPADMGPYYENYYSTGSVAQSPPLQALFLHQLGQIIGRAAMRYPSPLSPRILDRRVKPGAYLGFRSLYSLGLEAHSAILDVGCGDGGLVETLDRIGFSRVCGCDPYLQQETRFRGGSRLVRKDLADMEGLWDLIMLHHSFEHVPNPTVTAKLIGERLALGGRCLLRFPNVDSVEFSRYGENWWGIHAPRHYHLLSRQAVERVFANTGLRVERVWCDSMPEHYLFSYEYSLDISDGDPASVRKQGIPSARWNEREIAHINRNVEWYNKQLIGDWIVYVLRK